MSKRQKTVRVGDIEVTPITKAEHRRLEKRIQKRYARYRRRYKEIQGKRVDWVDFYVEEGDLYVNIRFTDGKNFSLGFRPEIATRWVEFSDMSSGDDEIIKTYVFKGED